MYRTRASSQESIDEIEEEGQNSDYSLEFDDDNEALSFGLREDTEEQDAHAATNSAAVGVGSATQQQQREEQGLGHNALKTDAFPLQSQRTRSPR